MSLIRSEWKFQLWKYPPADRLLLELRLWNHQEEQHRVYLIYWQKGHSKVSARSRYLRSNRPACSRIYWSVVMTCRRDTNCRSNNLLSAKLFLHLLLALYLCFLLLCYIWKRYFNFRLSFSSLVTFRSVGRSMFIKFLVAFFVVFSFILYYSYHFSALFY